MANKNITIGSTVYFFFADEIISSEVLRIRIIKNKRMKYEIELAVKLNPIFEIELNLNKDAVFLTLDDLQNYLNNKIKKFKKRLDNEH